MPKVSVIIPSFNRASFLPRAIHSVLAQTYTDYELIVVDDGSTDGTPEVVEEARQRASKPLEYIRQQNRGEPAARNRGLAAAHGQYVAFLDSDDFWLPPHLERSVGLLEEDPTLAAVFTDHGITRDGREVVATAAGHTGAAPELLKRLVLRDLILASDAVVARKATYAAVGGFDEQLLTGSDWEMWARFATRHKVGYVAALTVVVQQHDENSSANPPRLEEYAARALRVIMSYAPPEIARLERRARARNALDAAYFYALADDGRGAVRRVARAVRLDWRLLGHRILSGTVARLVLGRRGFESLRRIKNWRTRRALPAACSASLARHGGGREWQIPP